MIFHMKYFSFCILFLACIGTQTVHANEVHNSYQGTWRARVVEVLSTEMQTIPGTNTEHLYQTITAEVFDGPQSSQVITIENDFLELKSGDTFYFNHNIYFNGTESYGVINIDRSNALFFLVALFIIAVLLLGKWQGFRSLCALAGSFFAIFYILIPGILSGWNPLWASFIVASVILFAAIFFTHGFNRESLIAYSGTMTAILLTTLLAIFAVGITNLTGFSSEITTYLNFNTGGSIDFTALLLGAIIIGVLGVLDDIAVTQAAVVTELWKSNAKLTKKEVYERALRVGREHVGALVNTLVLAYTGASLPLLLHVYMSSTSVSMALSTELFATEIVRTIIGSIGLILTVPIVTLLAVMFLKNYTPKHANSHTHIHTNL